MSAIIPNTLFFSPVSESLSAVHLSIHVDVLDEFTDDVYFMHEELLQDLEAQYEMNRSIYEQIETWNELFLEFQHFEVRLPRSLFPSHTHI